MNRVLKPGDIVTMSEFPDTTFLLVSGPNGKLAAIRLSDYQFVSLRDHASLTFKCRDSNGNNNS